MWLWPSFNVMQEKQVAKSHLTVYIMHRPARALVEVGGTIVIYMEPECGVGKGQRGLVGEKSFRLLLGTLLFHPRIVSTLARSDSILFCLPRLLLMFYVTSLARSSHMMIAITGDWTFGRNFHKVIELWEIS